MPSLIVGTMYYFDLDDIKKQFEDVMTPLAMELLKDRVRNSNSNW